ncbi:MAG: ParB N-terminal domain-containing protein [Pyrinomonadaceae bacterium]
MAYKEEKVSHDQMLFDPNNYRYQDNVDFVPADDARFHEAGVQERAYKRLRKEESLLDLKKSIVTNGFIPVERLVLRAYEHEEGKYVVLEGNRRLAAMRWIAEDNEAGVPIPANVLATLNEIPAVIVEGDVDAAFYESLMGVRHVSGIREWGGYQRAKLVVDLRDKYELTGSDVADRLGMKPHEVNRRYRAFKALRQMQDDDDFGGYAGANMYPLFHEAVSLTAVKDWLGWQEGTSSFSKAAELSQFYGLLSPFHDDETDQTLDPKINTFSQVRELREILPNAEARRILLDPTRSFFDAVSVAKRDELSKTWATQVAEAIGALHALSVFDLQQLVQEDLDQIAKIRDVAQQLIDTYNKLKN